MTGDTKARIVMILVIVVAITIAVCMIAGCSWQGQKQYGKDGQCLSEWWSMRWCWMSAGVESYTKTPYYETGATLTRSQSDSNSITATGTAVGEVVGQAVKGVVK